MKTKENNTRDAREIFCECLKTLGFSIYTLNEFFYFLRDCIKEVEDILRKIDGGVGEEGSNIILRLDWPHSAFMRRVDRHELTSKAWTIGTMSVRDRNEELDGDLELIQRPKADFNILTDKKLTETRRLLVTSFIERFGFNHSTELNAYVNHWRGLLDTRRVDLKLTGKDDYPKDIKQADLFLRILSTETKVKRRYRKRSKGHESGKL